MPKITRLSQLQPDKRNARRRTPKSETLLERSLKEFGAARSVVIDENGKLLAGHGTVEAAAKAGIEKVIVIPSDGKTLVAVQRDDLDDDQKVQYAIADNRGSDLSAWDPAVLEELANEHELGEWFGGQDELDAILGKESDDDDDLAEDDTDKLGTNFCVLITCTDEVEQEATLEKLQNEGYEVRALVS